MMINTPRRTVQRPLLSSSYLIVVVLLAGFFPLIALLSSQVAYASPLATRHTKAPFPIFRHPVTALTAPPSSHSQYISPLDGAKPRRLYADGCVEASSSMPGMTNIVILDFGAIVSKNGAYGTYLPGSNPKHPAYMSNSQIQTLVEQYLTGYNDCNAQSVILYVGIGTNNQRLSTVSLATADGKEWGTLVSDVGLWITLQGYPWEYAIGASDIELDWSSPALAKAWTNGFLKTGSSYFDYGDAAGCPTRDSTIDGTCTTPHFVWKQSDVVDVSWGANGTIYPLPEIYARSGVNAKEWQSIEYYQHKHPGTSGFMAISGAFTQYAACLKKPADCYVGTPKATNNTPAQGWTQLYNALNNNKETQQELPFLSDIGWD